MEDKIKDVVQNCECRSAFKTSPHSKVAVYPPSLYPQVNISLDLIHLDRRNYLHSIEESTSWSEIGYICRKTMDVQIELLRRFQYQRHGPPKSIKCDKEYDNVQFRTVCAETMPILNLVTANDHDSNGLIENANQTLRSFYNQIRQCDRRSANEIISGEALFGKNISRGSNKALAFNLLYGRSPRMIPEIVEQRSPPISIEEQAKHVPVEERIRCFALQYIAMIKLHLGITSPYGEMLLDVCPQLSLQESPRFSMKWFIMVV